jgi:hypothetical protein
MNRFPGDAMADAPRFANLVPGFDFLQNLVKNAGAAMPSIGQWVAPTLDPAEIEKRIDELKTVQFWLEQNARMLGATIQALEVQRMTLSTLQTMNVQMADLRDSLTIRLPESTRRTGTASEPATASGFAPAPAPAPAPVASPAPLPPDDDAAPRARTPAAAPDPAPDKKAAGPVDPLQWWGALTKQFTDLATSAIKDSAADAAKSFGAMASRVESATGAQRPKAQAASPKAAGKRGKAARKGAKRAGKPAAKAAASQA